MLTLNYTSFLFIIYKKKQIPGSKVPPRTDIPEFAKRLSDHQPSSLSETDRTVTLCAGPRALLSPWAVSTELHFLHMYSGTDLDKSTHSK